MQFLDNLVLGRHSCLGLSHARRQSAGVKASQSLTFAHAVAFLHKHGSDSFAIVAGELDLAQIDISVKYEFMLRIGRAPKTPDSHHRHSNDRQTDHKDVLFHGEQYDTNCPTASNYLQCGG
jgi:hypothetical protein